MYITARSFSRFFIMTVLVLSLFIVVPDSRAGEMLISVDTTIDDLSLQACTSSPGDCSLRGAITKANNDLANTYTIHIPGGVYTLTLEGSNEDNNTTGDLDILVSINLEGEGIDQTVLQAGASANEGIDRVLDILNVGQIDVEISKLTIRHGKVTESQNGAGIQANNVDLNLTLNKVAFRNNLGVNYVVGGGLLILGNLFASDCQFTDNQVGGEGGAIYQSEYSDVTLSRVLMAGNSAQYGGAFTNNSVATLINTTISGNTATASGGGISQWGSGDLKIHYSTIVNNINTGSSTGWAIYNPPGLIMEAYNSIITAETGKSACSSTLDDGDHNIGSDSSCGTSIQLADPMIMPLAENGGNTRTHALEAGSPAIDSAGQGGNAIPCPAVDQRGFFRPFDGNDDDLAVCDIGAYEISGYVVFVPMLKVRK